jgi:hypothetical protein
MTPGGDMPLFSNPQNPGTGTWEPEAAEGRLAKTAGASQAGAHATGFLATGTAVRRLTDGHRLPETTPRPTFTLGLDS